MTAEKQYGDSTPEINTNFVEYSNFDWSLTHRKFRACGVYVFDMVGTPYCKVGSTGAPKSRHQGMKSLSPYPLDFPYFVTGCGGASHIDIELAAQAILSEKSAEGEWFECSADEAIAAIRAAVSQYGAAQ